MPLKSQRAPLKARVELGNGSATSSTRRPTLQSPKVSLIKRGVLSPLLASAGRKSVPQGYSSEPADLSNHSGNTEVTFHLEVP